MPGGEGLNPNDPNAQQAGADQTANLVELSVYGLVSLYETYPPKAPPAEAGAVPGAPADGAPGAPPAGAPAPPPGAPK
jgi:hypothetical protein